jgi:chemotaxis protein CheZ
MSGQRNFPQRPVFSIELRQGVHPTGSGNGTGAPSMRPAPNTGNGAAAPVSTSVPSKDIEELHAAIRGLGEKIDNLQSSRTVDESEFGRVREEVLGIANRIEMTKREIASIRHPSTKADKISSASVELSHVVKSTEAATNEIMGTAEKIEEVVHELQGLVSDSYANSRLNEIADQITRLFEACTFQDLTGQRITKVVRTLTFIEERVAALMELWGEKDIATAETLEDNIEKRDDGLVLHGPQTADQAISQDEIDKLFS